MKKKILLAAIAMSLSCSFMANAATGWSQEGETWRYYKDEATLATDCFVKSEDSVYYLDAEGNMVANQEIEHDGKKYSLNEQGQVLNSWVVAMDSCYYYSDTNGKVLVNTTTPDGYQVDANGVWNPVSTGTETQVQETEAQSQEAESASDEEIGYQALKSLYKTAKKKALFNIGYVKCMDISYKTGNVDTKINNKSRLVLINYSASNSFGAAMDQYYGYEVKSDGNFVIKTDPVKFYSASVLNKATNVVTLDEAALLKRVTEGK